ncbi:hypothetical protein GCM10010917_06120 [Paenibacillus physcomitrellae]|uniref:GrpB family protein n=1 Tax=Paenibacillus physcomitrellae TaxID=1619311 RepID=A0ABQ1FQD8_9BACL|nr:hypothetical protein GCM10010917_06120 [Paenibacillus physcomitrellae]
MDTTWKISAYDPIWRERFIEVGRQFRETPGNRRTHVHVRETGSFSEQMSLLFRD